MADDSARHTDTDNGTDGALLGYESPRLTLVGNLNDLLAGTGSLNADDDNCVGTGSNSTICP
jgi:hypothetical protein